MAQDGRDMAPRKPEKHLLLAQVFGFKLSERPFEMRQHALGPAAHSLFDFIGNVGVLLTLAM